MMPLVLLVVAGCGYALRWAQESAAKNRRREERSYRLLHTNSVVDGELAKALETLRNESVEKRCKPPEFIIDLNTIDLRTGDRDEQ